MPSPFPGMNPYLEQRGLWRGFHTLFLAALHDAITPLIVPRYYVELEESLYLDRSSRARRAFAVADAAIAEGGEVPEPAGAPAVVAVAAPVTVTVPVAAKKKARRLAIRDRKRNEIVTVLELLSPSNKDRGADRNRYLDKRLEFLESAANFIEIDLLRGGERMPIRRLPPCDEYVLVSRGWERPQMGLWPVRLRDPLPAIPIPLRRGESEPTIDLQAILHRVYDASAYAYRVYDDPPEPPLSARDDLWARDLLGRAGVA